MEQRIDNFVDIDALMKDVSRVRKSMVVWEPRKKKAQTRKAMKASGALQGHVRKQNVVMELASASSLIKYGHLFRGDANEARKHLRHLVFKAFMVNKASMVCHPDFSRQLEVLTV